MPNAIVSAVSSCVASEGWMIHLSFAAAGLAVGIVLAGLLCVLHFRRQNRRERYILENLSARVFVADAAGNLYFHSIEHADAGTPEAALPVSPAPQTLDELPAALHELLHGTVARVLSTGQAESIRYALAGWSHEARVSPVPPDVFGVPAVLWVSTDATARDAALLGARNMAERLQLILQSIGDGVLAVDRDARILRMNSAAAKLLGVADPGASIGRKLDTVFRLVGTMDKQPIEDPLPFVVMTGNTLELSDHTELQMPDGSYRHISNTIAPVREDDRTISGAVIIFRDVTEDDKKRGHLDFQNRVLRRAAEFAKIIYFRCDEHGINLNSEEEDGSFWKHAYGRRLAPSEWVHPDDLSLFQREWGSLLAGKKDEIEIVYRAGGRDGGAWRYYEMLAGRHILPGSGSSTYFGVIKDIAKFKDVDEKHMELNTFLSGILDNIPVYVSVKDADGGFRYLLANRAFERFCGNPEGGTAGKNDYDIYSRENARLLRVCDERVLASGGEEKFSLTLTVGECEHTIQYYKKCIRRPDGSRLILTVGSDETEDALLARKNRALFEQTEFIMSYFPEAVAVRDASDHFRLIMCNRAYERLSGRLQADILGRTLVETFGDTPSMRVMEAAQREAALTGRTSTFDRDFVLPSGESRRFRFSLTAHTGGNGKMFLLTVFSDMASDLEKENRIVHLRKLCSDLLEAYPGFAALKDPADEFRYIAGNTEFSRVLGLASGEAVGKTDADLIPLAGDAQKLAAGDSDAATGKKRQSMIDLLCGDGRRRTFQIRKFPVTAESGNSAVLQTGVDVTAARADGDRLRETGALIRALIDNLPCPFFVKDPDREFRYVMHNRAFGRLFDPLSATGASLIGKTDYDLLPFAADSDFWREQDRQACREEHPVSARRSIIIGTKRFCLETLKTKVVRPGGSPLLLGVCLDMSRQEQMERQAEQAQSILEAVADNFPTPVFIKDAKADFTYSLVNRAFLEMMKTNRNDILGKNDYQFFARREDAEKCRLSDLDAAQKAGSAGSEAELFRKDGTSVVFQVSKRMVDFPDGRRLLFGAAVDVTGRRLLEERCGDAERLFAAFSCNLSSLLFVKEGGGDGVFRYRTANPALHELLGFPDGFMIGKTDRELFPQEQADHTEKEDMALCEGREPLEQKVEPVNARNGRSVLIRLRKLPFRSASGAPLILGIGQDVTAETDLTARLEEVKREKFRLLDSLAIPMVLFDPEMKPLWINAAARRMSAVSDSELFARPCWRTFCKNSSRPEHCPVRLVQQDCRDHAWDFHSDSADYLFSAHPVMDGGKLCYILKVMLKKTSGVPEFQPRRAVSLSDSQSVGVAPLSDSQGVNVAPIADALRKNAPAVLVSDGSTAAGAEYPEGLLVLAVDDIPTNLKILAKFLTLLRCTAKTANSGREALAWIQARPRKPDVILSDLWMPEMNGCEFARAVRALPGCEKIHIAAVTADIEARQAFDMSCFERILLKPITRQGIQTLLSSLYGEKS